MKPEEIRQKREEAGWSQQELAEKVGAPSSSVYKWEKGMSRPSKNNQKRLEDVFSSKADSGAGNDSEEVQHLRQRISDLENLVASKEDTIQILKEFLDKKRSSTN